MWNLIQDNAVIVLECPSRWYIGRVKKRDHLTCILEDVVCGHDLGDLAMFMEGTISTATELSPLLDQLVEVNFSAIETVQTYDEARLAKISKRTHARLAEKVLTT